MAQYYHAHKIVNEKCCGHMTCMRNCPTQAIRVRDGKVSISGELCVDCGTCLSVCPSKAIVPISDTVFDISKFKYKIAVPSPVLYTQFDPQTHPYFVDLALKQLGFDEVVDVSVSSAALVRVLDKYLRGYSGRLPLISSHCPAAIRLIQVKYPDLVELIVPLDVPREVTAREIRKTYPEKLGLHSDEVGIIYIAPCPAKIVSIKQPAEKAESYFDGALSIKDVYSILLPHIIALKESFDIKKIPDNFAFNAGWVSMGSITRESTTENWLAVSGLDHVKKIFDDIENSKLRNVEFVEALTCMMGCIGGPFTVENTYVARANNIKQRQKYEQDIMINDQDIAKKIKSKYYFFEKPILPRPTTFFDTDLETSIKRMRERERIYQKLPQIDCGCCGSPTCLVFAEDFVRGEVKLTDCIFFTDKVISD
jgi:iron only hydrogenase large subunit-like protein